MVDHGLISQQPPNNFTAETIIRHAGCACPPEFTGEHCELLDYENYDPAAHHRDPLPQSPNTEERLIISLVILLFVGVLASVGVRLWRRLRQQRRIRNPFNYNHGGLFDRNKCISVSGLPQPPHLEPSIFYKDDECADEHFIDPSNDDASGSSEDDDFHDALPAIS